MHRYSNKSSINVAENDHQSGQNNQESYKFGKNGSAPYTEAKFWEASADVFILQKSSAFLIVLYRHFEAMSNHYIVMFAVGINLGENLVVLFI